MNKTQKNNIIKVVKAMANYLKSNRSDFDYDHTNMETCTVGFAINERLFTSLNHTFWDVASNTQTSIITKLFGSHYVDLIVCDGGNVYDYEQGYKQMCYIHNFIISEFDLHDTCEYIGVDDKSKIDSTKVKITERIKQLSDIIAYAEKRSSDRLLGGEFGAICEKANKEIEALNIALSL